MPLECAFSDLTQYHVLQCQLLQDQIPAAFKESSTGTVKGKLVIDVENSTMDAHQHQQQQYSVSTAAVPEIGCIEMKSNGIGIGWALRGIWNATCTVLGCSFWFSKNCRPI
jgi:hypothetical protein